MALEIGDFDAYFAAVNERAPDEQRGDGHEPFRWQQRLLNCVLDSGRWPSAVMAPTGLGKSAVVDVHVFVNALDLAGKGPRVPRRMAVVVNRRALADKHLDRAKLINAMLSAAREGVLVDVAAALNEGAPAYGESSLDPICHVSLRGGLPTDPTWLDDPRRVAVIAATPDMWGSRLLFRGYGSSRRARPREAGLLAYDSVFVLDEAHLNGQLLSTATDVAAIVEQERGSFDVVPGLQVVAVTATPGDTEPGAARARERSIGIEPSDLDDDPEAAARLLAPKQVDVVISANWPKKLPPSRAYIDDLASHAHGLASRLDKADSETVLCVVNNVETAVQLAERLQRDVDPDAVVCWVGRMREMDLAQLRRRRPGVFTRQGDPTVRFLVATQTVEVGIDLDCAAMLTELSPGSSLVQRFGRVNRAGDRSSGPIRVVVPEGAPTDRPPYVAGDLADARDWLDSLSDGDVCPYAVLLRPPPAQSRRRMLLSPFYREHARLLSATSDQLFAEPALEFWLREDLELERDPVGIVLRELVVDGPTESPLVDDGIAFELLRATPVDSSEVFPTTVDTAEKLVKQILAKDVLPRVFFWRGDELEQATQNYRPRPGDTLVLDVQHPVTRMGVVTETPPKVAEELDTVWGPSAPDGSPQVEVHLEGELCELLAGVPSKEAQGVYDRFVADQAGSAPPGDGDLVENGKGDGRQIIVPVGGSLDGGPLPWIVLKHASLIDIDPETRQEWSRSDEDVALDAHQQGVAERAREMAKAVGLPSNLVRLIADSGRHHDDGKIDLRFQKERLDNDDSKKPLAKSGKRSAQAMTRRWGGAALPQGWRHEQLSAVSVWADPDLDEGRDLIARLVGTSHGLGRPFFPHGSRGLLPGSATDSFRDAADELFETGAGWSGVLARTEREFGIWGCAYLEALLRAADCQVSREGS